MKRWSLLTCLVVLVGVVCLAAGSFVWLAAQLPRQAAAAFGSPASSLNALQRLRLSSLLLLKERDLLSPRDPTAAPQPFEIELGESSHSITERLESEGLIKDANLLRLFLVYSGLDTSIQAGDYMLSARMTPVQIAHALQDATPTEVSFRVLPGWRLEEIAEALPTSGLSFSPEAFLALAYDPPGSLPVIDQLPPRASLEGFLFPDGYRLKRDLSVEAFARTLLLDFQAKVGQELINGYAAQGLDLYSGVTLASMVEREAVIDEEMPLIASVFYNRLKMGMRLESDPTAQYGLGFDPIGKTWWKNPLSLDDVQVNSKFNTYRIHGLPPGPICAPGPTALRAAAFPAQTQYFYFRAACDGSGRHEFAETYEQHQSNACPQ